MSAPMCGRWSPERIGWVPNAADVTKMKGVRDRAIMAVLLGCALRRSEGGALTNRACGKRHGFA